MSQTRYRVIFTLFGGGDVGGGFVLPFLLWMADRLVVNCA